MRLAAAREIAVAQRRAQAAGVARLALPWAQPAGLPAVVPLWWAQPAGLTAMAVSAARLTPVALPCSEFDTYIRYLSTGRQRDLVQDFRKFGSCLSFRHPSRS